MKPASSHNANIFFNSFLFSLSLTYLIEEELTRFLVLIVFLKYIPLLEKAMAPPLQYSCLENPWTEEPGGLQSMGSLRVGHD